MKSSGWNGKQIPAAQMLSRSNPSGNAGGGQNRQQMLRQQLLQEAGPAAAHGIEVSDENVAGQ